MLFLVFGSSAAGKTFALNAVRGRIGDLAIHDFDEIGVPSHADMTWRQRSNEVWIARAIEYQVRGVDLLLAGQTPIGELLASPSASSLEAISACLIDCDDETRVARLYGRGPQSERSGGDLDAYLAWAEWMRRHADDPRWRPDVIREGAAEDLHWGRWSDWRRGDPRWRVHVVDTTTHPVEDVAMRLCAWIDEERALVRSGTHPLQGWADD